MKTKFGNAKINKYGYYQITSRKEGNRDKLLHRLVFEDYHNCKLDKTDVIHHIDFDKTNNHPTNLICMSRKAHQRLHQTGKIFSDEYKKKMSELKKGKTLSNKHIENIIKGNNTSGYYHVMKQKNKNYKQGFIWKYQYHDEKGKRKAIYSVDIKKLEEKVKSKGLKWRKIE